MHRDNTNDEWTMTVSCCPFVLVLLVCSLFVVPLSTGLAPEFQLWFACAVMFHA